MALAREIDDAPVVAATEWPERIAHDNAGKKGMRR
jgi:hypothetical protein